MEVREASDGAHLTGYAAVWDADSEPIMGVFIETLRRGCFADSLDTRDTIALCQHREDLVLGRRSAGTLKVGEDDTGLSFDITLPDTTYARDLMESVKRGDISGMSFGFDVIDDRWSRRDGRPYREVMRADLYEISPVTSPAYPETSVSVRSLRHLVGGVPLLEQELRLREAGF